jgi:protein-tyrosine-phosphatase
MTDKTINLLFICKYNRFRSKFAEAYFKKINKNKNINVESAGIIEVDKPLCPNERTRNNYIQKEFGLYLSPKSRGISASLLEKQDKIIIVADDVPGIIFTNWRWKDKVQIWKIKDESASNLRNVNKLGKIIMKRVNKLVKQLNNQEK